MEEEDAAADPYLPYDGGGDTIPLQEIPRRGTPHPLFSFSPFPPIPSFLGDDRGRPPPPPSCAVSACNDVAG